jgi:hypothetical protein
MSAVTMTVAKPAAAPVERPPRPEGSLPHPGGPGRLALADGSRQLDDAIAEGPGERGARARGRRVPVLGESRNQLAGTLSGGERQMLSMAAAYVREARVILVDEASLGLAPLIVDVIFGFLTGVAATGASLLIVDQYATRALTIADVAYVLRRGEIVYSGTQPSSWPETCSRSTSGTDVRFAVVSSGCKQLAGGLARRTRRDERGPRGAADPGASFGGGVALTPS